MTIDRRALISLAFSLSIMAVVIVWNRVQPKLEPDLVKEAGVLQLAGKYHEVTGMKLS